LTDFVLQTVAENIGNKIHQAVSKRFMEKASNDTSGDLSITIDAASLPIIGDNWKPWVEKPQTWKRP
jgi:hypothetical protein